MQKPLQREVMYRFTDKEEEPQLRKKAIKNILRDLEKNFPEPGENKIVFQEIRTPMLTGMFVQLQYRLEPRAGMLDLPRPSKNTLVKLTS